jgi:hypothetical protein
MTANSMPLARPVCRAWPVPMTFDPNKGFLMVRLAVSCLRLMPDPHACDRAGPEPGSVSRP